MKKQDSERKDISSNDMYKAMFNDFFSHIRSFGDEDADILWLVFEDCLRNGQYEVCSELLRMFNPIEPRNIVLKKVLQAKLCIETGELNRAEKYLREASRIGGKNFEALRMQGYTLHLLGLVLAEKGDTKQALNTLRRAIKLYDQAIRQSRKRDIVSLRNKGLVLRDLGEILAESGRYREALRALSSSVRIYNEVLRFMGERDLTILNDKANSLRLLGETLSELGDEEGAIENIASAIHIHERVLKERRDFDPTTWYYRGLAYQSLGEIFIRQGDFANALGAFSEAVSSFRMSIRSAHGANPNAWHSLGLVFQSLGEIAMSRSKKFALGFMVLALVAYRKALMEQNCRSGATLFNMGLALSDIGTLLYDMDASSSEKAFCLAIEYMKEALDKSPEILRDYIRKTIIELLDFVSTAGFSCKGD